MASAAAGSTKRSFPDDENKTVRLLADLGGMVKDHIPEIFAEAEQLIGQRKRSQHLIAAVVAHQVVVWLIRALEQANEPAKKKRRLKKNAQDAFAQAVFLHDQLVFSGFSHGTRAPWTMMSVYSTEQFELQCSTIGSNRYEIIVPHSTMFLPGNCCDSVAACIRPDTIVALAVDIVFFVVSDIAASHTITKN